MAAAADKSGVRVGKHQMGETLAQWLTISDIDLEPFYADLSKERSDRIRALMEIDSRGSGELQDSPSGGTDPDLVRWLFDNGKLAEYFLSHGKSDMQQHLEFLTAAYGPPATRGFRDFHN